MRRHLLVCCLTLPGRLGLGGGIFTFYLEASKVPIMTISRFDKHGGAKDGMMLSSKKRLTLQKIGVTLPKKNVLILIN